MSDKSEKIKTWGERCEDFDDGHITTHADIQRVMQDEIDELREELARRGGVPAEPVWQMLCEAQLFDWPRPNICGMFDKADCEDAAKDIWKSMYAAWLASAPAKVEPGETQRQLVAGSQAPDSRDSANGSGDSGVAPGLAGAAPGFFDIPEMEIDAFCDHYSDTLSGSYSDCIEKWIAKHGTRAQGLKEAEEICRNEVLSVSEKFDEIHLTFADAIAQRGRE